MKKTKRKQKAKCRKQNISLLANLYPPITYSHHYMLNGAYGNRTRRLLLAKQASPHCD